MSKPKSTKKIGNSNQVMLYTVVFLRKMSYQALLRGPAVNLIL